MISRDVVWGCRVPVHDDSFVLDQHVRRSEPDRLRVVAIIQGDGDTAAESAPEVQKRFNKTDLLIFVDEKSVVVG